MAARKRKPASSYHHERRCVLDDPLEPATSAPPKRQSGARTRSRRSFAGTSRRARSGAIGGPSGSAVNRSGSAVNRKTHTPNRFRRRSDAQRFAFTSGRPTVRTDKRWFGRLRNHLPARFGIVRSPGGAFRKLPSPVQSASLGRAPARKQSGRTDDTEPWPSGFPRPHVLIRAMVARTAARRGLSAARSNSNGRMPALRD